MKRLLSILLTLAMLMSTFMLTATATAEGSALPFTDVKASKWYYDAVKTVWEEGIMEGKSEGIFAPNEPMTRAQIVTIFYRLADRFETGLGKSLNFTDTKKNAWYADYLGWAVAEELVGGYPEGDFRPNNAITRQELAKLIVEFLKYVIAKVESESLVESFADEKKFPGWSREYIESLRETGLMGGDESGNFNPKQTATRAEVATVIVRMLPFVKEAIAPKAPPMGWQSYMAYHWTVNEEAVLAQMDAMIDTGLYDAGYEYINIDDWWYTTRNEETGRVDTWEDHFPNGMKYIADEAHKRGLKAGIYTDLGYNSCGSGNDDLPLASGINVGLQAGNYVDDLWRYLGTGTYTDDYAKQTGTDPIECWGFDYLKVDSNGTKEGVEAQSVLQQYADVIDDIERETGRFVHFNMCRWYYEGPYQLVSGDSWRVGTDSYGSFEYTKTTIDKMKRASSYTVPGHYADLDMFVFTGNFIEDRTNFAMWCMFSSPLMISQDIRTLTEEQLSLLTDTELIALDQDPLAYAAAYIEKLGDTTELWFKKTGSYESGTGAIAIYNPGDAAETVTLKLSDICKSGKAEVRDVFAKSDLGKLSEITVTVEPHGVYIYTIDTDEGYTSDDIGDYRVYGVVNTEYDEAFTNATVDTFPIVTLDELPKLLKMPEKFRPVVIDVRSPEEYEKGHLDGVLNIPYMDVRNAITQLKLPLGVKAVEGNGTTRDLILYAGDEETLYNACREFEKFRYTVKSLGVLTEFE